MKDTEILGLSAMKVKLDLELKNMEEKNDECQTQLSTAS